MNWILERRNLCWSEFTPAMHAGARVCGSRYAVLCVRPEEMTGTSRQPGGYRFVEISSSISLYGILKHDTMFSKVS